MGGGGGGGSTQTSTDCLSTIFYSMGHVSLAQKLLCTLTHYHIIINTHTDALSYQL